MEKSKALSLLGGSVTSAARAVGVNPQAVTQWPGVLPRRIADRVLAAWVRREMPDLVAKATAEQEKPHV